MWIQERLSYELAEIQLLTCPSANLAHELSMEEVIDIARGSDFEAVLDRMVLLKTLRYMDGVLICPRQYCDYAGWVRPNFTCDRPLECELCGYTWRSMQLLPLYRRVFHCIKSLATGQEDSLSFVWLVVSDKLGELLVEQVVLGFKVRDEAEDLFEDLSETKTAVHGSGFAELI